MADSVSKLETSPGYLITTDDYGRKTSHPIADMLRAADIPTGLTYQQLGAITTLANLIAVLIRTLISRGVLDESFMEQNDYDLDAIVETIQNMGGDFGEPSLVVS